MQKVGIMTWFQYHNYGTALQVTALSEILKKMDCSPMVIQYYTNPNAVEDVNESFFGGFVRKVVLRLKYFGKVQYSSTEREKKFDEFLSNHLQFTDKCETLSELGTLNDEFDYFICGSDQIWSPSYFDPHYFLDFVIDDSKKIAYAPSIGLSKIKNNEIKKEMARLCRSFAHLSTREESGSKIIDCITEKKVKTVLDPTLLLDKNEWSKFESKDISMPNVPYLLVYMLGQNEQHWKVIHKIAMELKLKIKIIPVFRKDFLRNGCIMFPIGPAEFLSLIRSASFICTDSFHGMAFSVNYGKQFVVFERFLPDDPINQNSRIYNLAEKFDLGNRILAKDININMISNDIDYNHVYFKLNSYITESLKYLQGSLRVE